MLISEITNHLESIAPLHLQESYDNSGLLIGDVTMEVNRVLISLDVTPDVIREAIDEGCNMVIAHHPLIFRGLKRLSGGTYVERAILLAIKHDIAVYAIHTNLDNVLRDGVNGRIADKLGLTGCLPLAPHDEADRGAGVVGDLVQDMTEREFLAYLKERMELRVIRHTALTGERILRVAVCGGSGSFLLPRAVAAGARVFVSADFKYHDFFDADGCILVADIGHFESERFTMHLIHDLLQRKFPNFAAQLTTTVTNPITFYP